MKESQPKDYRLQRQTHASEMTADATLLSGVWNKTTLIHQEGASVHQSNNENMARAPDRLQLLIWWECTPPFSKLNSKLHWIIFKTDLKTSHDI